MATTHTAFGRFLNYYRSLRRANVLDRVPVLLSEGDSWFSTPLYYNLVDWLEVSSPSGAFLRMESSGDLATKMFRGSNLKRIVSRVEAIEFDVLMISAGGNDLVDEFLAKTFKGAGKLSVDQAFQRVLDSKRFDAVYAAYEALITAVVAARPNITILAHTYDYPIRMGVEGKLTVEQIGLIAWFKRSVGDWIAKHIRHALPSEDEQRAFARRMMDHYHDHVLVPLAENHKPHFHFVNLRGHLAQQADWNDEMHPTGDAFRRLAEVYRVKLRELLPEAKRAAIG